MPRPIRQAMFTSLVLTLGLGLALARAGDKDKTKSPPDLCGRISRLESLTVLELWGTPEQSAFAHGYLMAEPIIQLFDDYVLDPKITPNPAFYEAVVRAGVRRLFVWDAAREAELRALCDGVVARLGREGARSKKLDRELDVTDLMAVNTLADWHGAFCSSFSAWGALTADGAPLTGRNLDFPATPSMAAAQFALVYRGDGHHAAWVGLTWPGLIGVYSAMNANGVGLFIHDASGRPADDAAGFTPRTLILREALEAATADAFIDDVKRVFESRRVMVGNNILVSGPFHAGQPAAVVFEFDGSDDDRGVTVRLPDADVANGEALCCTNHMCDRVAARPGSRDDSWTRYLALQTGLTAVLEGGPKLTVERAFGCIDSTKRRTTLHTVVAEPARRMLHVRIPALGDRIVILRVDDWLRR